MWLWLYLAAALLAGFLPARVFWGRGMMFMDGAQLRARFLMANPGDNRRRRRWWKGASVWAEPLRGAGVGWALCRGVPDQLAAMNIEPELFRLCWFGLLLLVLGIVGWQTFGREKEKETLAPLLFIAGILAGGFGWVLGISALALALLALFASQSVAFSLIVMTGTTVMVGWFLLGPGVTWLVACACCGLPWFKAFAFRLRLVLALRG